MEVGCSQRTSLGMSESEPLKDHPRPTVFCLDGKTGISPAVKRLWTKRVIELQQLSWGLVCVTGAAEGVPFVFPRE